jgi:hypothetical protein
MTREGYELQVGDILVDLLGGLHQIERIEEYPARFIGSGRLGDHARVAYAYHWERTIADHETFVTARRSSGR